MDLKREKKLLKSYVAGNSHFFQNLTFHTVPMQFLYVVEYLLSSQNWEMTNHTRGAHFKKIPIEMVYTIFRDHFAEQKGWFM